MAKHTQTGYFMKMGAVIVVSGMLLLAGANYFGLMGGGSTLYSVNGGTTGTETGTGGAVATYDTSNTGSLTVYGIDKVDGNASTFNSEVWTTDSKPVKSETSTAGATALTGMPMNTDLYLMIGNDNYQSSTDRGTEYYYQKIDFKFGTNGQQSLDTVFMFPEGTPTWTGYDDGTAETTTNLSVSTSIITSAELKISPSSNDALGNPQFDNPLAVCFNATTSSVWDNVRPTSYVETISVPSFLKGVNAINGNCYVLPTKAIVSGLPSSDYPSEYRFGLTIDPASDPAVTDYTYAFLLDKTYFKDDSGKWNAGWGDESDQSTDTDIGMDAITNSKAVWYS